ncbi:MAG: hypothetical protein M3441_15780 [Chloroflexota bacterium]|nr:hypothetical protein [Chloroflexota bacterium]
MANDRPSKVRRVGYQDEPGPAPAINPIRIFAGIGAILFPLLNVLPLRFIDIERYNPSNTVAGLLFLLAYVLLLPLVYVLYQELRAVSPPPGTWVSLLGVGVPAGVASGVIFGLNVTIAAIFTVTCLALWIGLSGYVAFSQRILGRVWSVFSMAVGANAVVAGLLSIAPQFLGGVLVFFAWVSYGLAVALWVVWTGVMFMRRARMTPTEA